MFGALTKTYYAEKMGLDPHDIVCVSVMPLSLIHIWNRCQIPRYSSLRSTESAASACRLHATSSMRCASDEDSTSSPAGCSPFSTLSLIHI